MDIIKEALTKTTDTKACVIGVGAMEKTPDMFKGLFPGKKAVIVADKNTYKAAGEFVEGRMRKASVSLEDSFIFNNPELYAEWTFVEELESYLKNREAIAIAVGSGVINDLTKLVSFRLGRKYMVVGTAASMDGYTAFGASITRDGNKQTFSCPAPYGVIMDPEVAAKAPEGLSASGYADLLAKVPAGADWMLSDVVGLEKIDGVVFNLVHGNLRTSLSAPEAVAKGKVKETEMLSEGLIMSGFAMQAHQSSRPASGLEHQFSHYWDMENHSFNGEHVSHGFKVGIGTIVSTYCLEYLLDYDMSSVDIDKCVAACPSWEERKKHIAKVFAGKRPNLLERALKESFDKYSDGEGLRRQLSAVLEAWPIMKDKIRSQIYSHDQIKDMLRKVGAPYESEMIGISKDRLKSTFEGIPYMRSRYSSIDLILGLGLIDEVKSYIFDRKV